MSSEDRVAGLGELLTQAGELSFDWESDGEEVGRAEELISVLCIRVGEDAFGVESSYVREIVGSSKMMPLPGAPAHIRGVLVHRRQVVGVLDLGVFLGLERTVPKQLDGVEARRGRTVIVEIGKYVVGISVDQVEGLEQWSKDAATEVGSIRKRTQRYMQSACYRGEVLTVLLDLGKLLEDAAVR